MAVLEAEMNGLPMIGVKQAGLIELISTNGFLSEPGNIESFAQNLEKVLFDEKLSSTMGAESLELIKPYSIDEVVDKLLNFYNQLDYRKK